MIKHEMQNAGELSYLAAQRFWLLTCLTELSPVHRLYTVSTVLFQSWCRSLINNKHLVIFVFIWHQDNQTQLSLLNFWHLAYQLSFPAHTHGIALAKYEVTFTRTDYTNQWEHFWSSCWSCAERKCGSVCGSPAQSPEVGCSAWPRSVSSHPAEQTRHQV